MQSTIDKHFSQTKPNMASHSRKRKSKSDLKKKKSSKKLKKSYRIPKKYRYKWNKKGGKVINVKEDKQGYSKSYRKQKVTKQQQKKINKRFKEGYSPFKDVFEAGFQEVIPGATGKCKWVWRCYNNLEYLSRAWQYFPDFRTIAGQQSEATITGSTSTAARYFTSPDQAIYYNQFKQTYEIFNPTNYDMNLVIYDLVCKQDSTGSVKNANYNTFSTTDNTTSGAHTNDIDSSARDPVRCIEMGLSAATGAFTYGQTITSSGQIVADSTQKSLYDITLKPTESYPFNIYWTIVKKHTFKLQPGATLTHKFIHKPKALMTRGYWGYRYGKDMKVTDGDRQRGIKDITSGCLFKFWGQVTGSAMSTKGTQQAPFSDSTEVTTLSGRIMFKEYVDNRWYTMNPKYTYTFKSNVTNYAPTDEEKMQVVNDATIHPANDAEMTVGPNNDETDPYD